MSPVVRTLESAIMEGKLRPGGNPCLTWNMANIAIERNATNERKFAKRKSTGLIDGAVALLMCAGSAPQGQTGELDVESMVNWVDL
jgi:phage terminase large subunit-like protein